MKTLIAVALLAGIIMLGCDDHPAPVAPEKDFCVPIVSPDTSKR
jgi:hypothetical protein